MIALAGERCTLLTYVDGFFFTTDLDLFTGRMRSGRTMGGFVVVMTLGVGSSFTGKIEVVVNYKLLPLFLPKSSLSTIFSSELPFSRKCSRFASFMVESSISSLSKIVGLASALSSSSKTLICGASLV